MRMASSVRLHTDSFPQNSVAADPTGKGYASGGEDGYVRVHHFDKAYFDFTYEVERERANNAL
jgi:translation initiation factor 3 subunit I